MKPSAFLPSLVWFVPLTMAGIAGAGCAFEVVPLGEDAKDDLRLKDSKLAYIAAALDGGDKLTLQDLFALGDDLPFHDAPKPTRLLKSMNALDDARGRAGKVEVTVLDYNVALLDARLLDVIPYKSTPYLEERRRALPGLVFDTGADIIGLQEVWTPQDVTEFTRQGQDAGYRAFNQEREEYNDGVMIFLREGAIAGGTAPELVFSAAYQAQDNLEFFPGPGIKRGYLEVAFTHVDAGPMRVFCTHMQAFPESWKGRMRQARELGIRARESSSDDELVVLLGDLNSGPFYARDKWRAPGDELQSAWLENTIAYPMLLEYGDLLDAAIMARPADLADDDVELGLTVKNDPDEAVKTPGVDKDWCDETPVTTFTATDCNSLYFKQYAGTEYPARIDHVHVRDRDDLVVGTSEILFTQKQRFGGVDVEPSDHFAVKVQLLVDPR